MYFKDLEELKTHVKSIEVKPSDTFMIFLGDESDQLYEPMKDYLNENNISFFGGIFPGLLVGDLYVKKGLIVNIIQPIFRTQVLPYLMKSYNGDLDGLTAFVVADGLSSQFKSSIDTLYKKLGNSVTYVGGGAGYYDLEHKPCVFDEKGLYMDSMIIALVEAKAYVEYKHGWERLKGPFVANKTLDNVISEIDYSSAFEVYSDIFEDISNTYITEDNFFDYAKDHPFGIVNNTGDDIVRDPIWVDNGSITCVASIPENSDVYILRGNNDTLLNASMEVANLCCTNTFPEYKAYLFDCISRAMYLEEQFHEELSNIQNVMDVSVYGALSIGEISSLKDGKIEIHNKSAVLAIVED